MKVMEEVVWKVSYPRNSHDNFLIENRDWNSVQRLWAKLLSVKTLPEFFSGDQEYGITRLGDLQFDREKEFRPNNPKAGRKTFSLVLGYNGSKYSGYQQQKGANVITVEDDLDLAFGRKLIASGRTDKDVSALSQVVCFSTFDNDVTCEKIMEQVQAAESIKNHNIAIWECERVPRKFHPIFSATWRRYIYAFPLNSGIYGDEKKTDIDVNFVNSCLNRLINRTLPYNGFAHRDDRTGGEGLQDYCVMFRARAEVMDLSSVLGFDETIEGQRSQILCIELVGSRFLRRMVRILVATVLRESVLPVNERDEDILLKIALTRDRGHAAYAVPGVGLALCGVGYSLEGDAHKDVMIPVEPHFQSVIDYYQQQAKSTKERLLDQDSDIERDEDEDQHDGSRKRKLSRRERYQQKMKKNNINDAISEDHLIPSHPATPNTQNLQAFLSDGSVTSFSSLINVPFENELMSKDGELLYYPERSFHFPQVGRDIVLTQSYSQIASTIWDAEVVLAHFLDQYKFSKETNSSHGEEGKSILVELGAGVGLAGMVASLKQYFNKVILQEIDEEAVQYMKERINEFKSSSNLKDSLNCEIVALPCLWGDEGVADIVKRIERSRNERIEWIVMADVLYHQEDFQSLLTTVKGLLLEGGNVLLAFEQRRKDVSAFLLQLRSLFRSCHVNEYAIKRDETITRIYLCHFEYFLS